MNEHLGKTAYFHLPGLFEFTELYRKFLPLFYGHREWFYENCEIASLYGAPADALWGGGRVGFGEDDAEAVLSLLSEYGISGRLTFSNSLLLPEHLSDRKCNKLCERFSAAGSRSDAMAGRMMGRAVRNGVIVHSELLLSYLRETYPTLYFVSSTTKCLTDLGDLRKELGREEFDYVVPDFRLNKVMTGWRLCRRKKKTRRNSLSMSAAT